MKLFIFLTFLCVQAHAQVIRSGGANITAGPAGGDLSGTYPNPTVIRVASGGVDLSTVTTALASKAASGANADITGMSALASLAVAGSTLTVANSGIITAPSQPAVRGVSNSVTVTNTGVAQSIWFGSEEYDTQNMHSVSVSSDTFTIPVGGGGIYFISCQVWFPASVTGTNRIVQLMVGGVEKEIVKSIPSATVDISIDANASLSLTAGNAVTCVATQDSGGPMSLCESYLCRMSVVKLW